MTEDDPASEVITTIEGQIEIENQDGAPMVNHEEEEKHQHAVKAVEEVIMKQLLQFTLTHLHHHNNSNIDNIPIQTHQIQQQPITLPIYPINKLPLINKLQIQKYN